MKFIPVLLLCFLTTLLQAQSLENRLSAGMALMEKDEQFAHASIGLYIVNSNTGQVVFDKNSQLGLAPASTQKVITSAAAFELLGKNYVYKTTFAYDGTITGNVLKGHVNVKASGDPTLGSWRWKNTAQSAIYKQLAEALKKSNISEVDGAILGDVADWETNVTPRGWTWEDVGNYYGAGASPLNWHENQYDLILRPGAAEGDSVRFIKTEPMLINVLLVNELKTGKPGSGDQSVIYMPENANFGFIRGTVPAGVETFTVKGSIPRADVFFLKSLEYGLKKEGIKLDGRIGTNRPYPLKEASKGGIPLLTLTSPPLDSINYWFLKESVNLFGEALVKTIALEKKGFAETQSGLDIIRDLWSTKAIEKSSLKIIDGSGLSPANRVTPHALVTVMRYAAKQEWFPSFYNSLPLQNNIKMKSGYIGGVRSYTGYIKSKTGEEYTFAFIINNFDGSPSAVREKMWKLLDIMK